MATKKTDLVHIGKTIQKARLEKSINLDFLANETGLSIDFLKRVESGEQRPSVGTLLQISRALGIDSGYFLKDQEDTAEQRAEAYTKRTDHYAYTPLTPGAENKHLKAFHIEVEAKKAHKGVGFIHEGEEFVYVLKGEVEVAVGDHVNHLTPGKSLHFNSGIKHDLRNVGDVDAELIVVVYSP
ncbi:MAG: helix-turn-helix domain-containing protein [Desulfobacteraceae bacterium]|nr:helix-turn-helix domain-containing protein [Desulfobacteraceae bacterium]